MELIRYLQEWHRAEIYQELLTAMDKTQTPISVNSILRIMEYGTFADRPGYYQPYRDLVATVGVSPLIEVMTTIFEGDPSRTQESVSTVEACFNEAPFPRYLVALCYAILHRQLIPQAQFEVCSRAQKMALRDALWQNIVDTGNLLPYPSAMVTVLTDQFSVQELLMRSLPLIADPHPTANTVGDILLNQLTLENETLVVDVVKALRQAINAETDVIKRKKYKTYLKGRSRSNVRSIVDLMTPWKQ